MTTAGSLLSVIEPGFSGLVSRISTWLTSSAVFIKAQVHRIGPEFVLAAIIDLSGTFGARGLRSWLSVLIRLAGGFWELASFSAGVRVSLTRGGLASLIGAPPQAADSASSFSVSLSVG